MPGNDKAVTLLRQNVDSDIVNRLQSHLQDGGWQVDKCRLGENMPLHGRDIIATTVGLESAFFSEGLTPDQLVVFHALLRHPDAEKVLWLCSPSQVQCKDPKSAQTLGIARTVRTELSIPFFTMEIDTKESRSENWSTGSFRRCGPLKTKQTFMPKNNSWSPMAGFALAIFSHLSLRRSFHRQF